MIGVPIQSAETATTASQGMKWLEVRLRWQIPAGVISRLPGASRSIVTRNHPIHTTRTPTTTATTPPTSVPDRAAPAATAS
jgi:hypothetical protein